MNAKQEWQALRRLYRDIMSLGHHYDFAAVMAAHEAVGHGIPAGFVLRHAGKLPACHPGRDGLDGTVIVPEA